MKNIKNNVESKDIQYTGEVPCRKCGQTHWMHGSCPENDQVSDMSQISWADSPIHDQVIQAGLDTVEGSLATQPCCASGSSDQIGLNEGLDPVESMYDALKNKDFGRTLVSDYTTSSTFILKGEGDPKRRIVVGSDALIKEPVCDSPHDSEIG